MTRQRVVIEGVTPQVDCGRYPVKRVIGEQVAVEADVFADGHEEIDCALLHRHDDDMSWTQTHMQAIGNDRWQAHFLVDRLGTYRYTVVGWMDHFATWRHALAKKADAGVDVTVDLLIGAALVRDARGRASGHDKEYLQEFEATLGDDRLDDTERIGAALHGDLHLLMRLWNARRFATRHDPDLTITVDRQRARFSAWYEMFPRSAGLGGQHGRFDDVRRLLPYVASMGFDVLYLPPIHPIGRVNRKGRNNRTQAETGDVGSPWAIGSEEGGHKAIHPDLGTFDDFHRLVQDTRGHGMEIALDIAFQCAPDHPYVRERPEWFRKRPDGTVQYAENPPKKYEDIYPLDFETDAWESLWEELKSIFVFWIQHDVKMFRVDNPHTKPLPFWEWLVGELRRDHPEVILLSEAFTRPKVMYRLAKLGYNQSYTYFAWRNAKHEIESYFTELTQPPVIDFFRANPWPNTPDILNAYLQEGGRPAFMIRLILAATLAANYGIYGPAFELGERVPREPGSEEYLNSEKYEIRQWDIDRLDSLRPLITRLNKARHENSALQSDRSLRFHRTDNDMIICYSKTAGLRPSAVGHRPSARAGHEEPTAPANIIVTVVNLDPMHTQSGWVLLPLHAFGIGADDPFEVHDLLADVHYTWRGEWNFVQLNPHALPAHVFAVHPSESSVTK